MAMELDRVRALLLADGRLRAAINYGNPVLAQRGPAGEPKGVSVALAGELARRLDAQLEIVPFEIAGAVVEAAGDDRWDVAFLAVDPQRADRVTFTAPYVLIEGTYLVQEQSPYRVVEALDAPGLRIAVGEGAAYDLVLTRMLKHAQILRYATSVAAVQAFLDGKTHAAAGVRQPLEAAARKYAGLRVLPGRFTAIEQAMAVPAAKKDAAAFLQTFLSEMLDSGFVARVLEDTGQDPGLAALARADR